MNTLKLAKSPKKCVHGKTFCCECYYGKGGKKEYNPMGHDAVTDMQGKYGYRLIAGFNTGDNYGN